MVGIRSFPLGARPIFRGELLVLGCFRECRPTSGLFAGTKKNRPPANPSASGTLHRENLPGWVGIQQKRNVQQGTWSWGHEILPTQTSCIYCFNPSKLPYVDLLAACLIPPQIGHFS